MASSLIAERQRDSTNQWAKTPEFNRASTRRHSQEARERDLIIFLRVPLTNVDSFGDSATIRLSESFALSLGDTQKEMTSSHPLHYSPPYQGLLENFIA
ncbi:hypothetical protein CDAR_51141 [Caerostris darwini]|uniref:Uncharacterized protein n=1 Tax=Caerostris darwini TaxID=1538125 RepID=A0AAV4U643_9ARAC|nr:hypothetical protein CDAR_51141 [Caerostris darwini]